MGNRPSSNPELLYRSYTRYGSVAEDSASLNDSIEQLEYRSTWRRRLALGAILGCQLFHWVAFTTIIFWIPQSLELNVFFFNSGAKEDVDGYYGYMEKVQLISVLALILLYSCGWISGLLMDSCVRKTHFILLAQVLATIGFSLIVAIILTLANNIKCQVSPQDNTSYSCSIEEFDLCFNNHGDGEYCLNVYIGWVCAVAVVSSVIRTTLPALGGDQIPDRDGVRLFYAAFYWFQKAGEAISAILCFVYLVAWRKFSFRTADDQVKRINSIDHVYQFFFYGWSGTISVACALALISVFVIVCGKVIRQSNPNISVIKDGYLIWKEDFRRRKEKGEDDGFLDLAKRSRGGSFADQAVGDRVDMLKFAVVLLLLIPVAFATTIPLLPVTPRNFEETTEERLGTAYHQSVVTVLLHMVRYTTALIAIPVIHIICTRLARCGRPLNILHRFLGGHIFMIGSIIALIVTQNCYNKEYTIKTQIAQMILLGVCNAFIFTTGYELTLLSAPRAMQGTAMGMFYLMDGIANIINMGIILYIDANRGSIQLTTYNILNGIGAGGMALAMLLLYMAEKKFNLGLSQL